jgi:hypothetical protein
VVQGYWLAGASGNVTTAGNAVDYGSPEARLSGKPRARL